MRATRRARTSIRSSASIFGGRLVFKNIIDTFAPPLPRLVDVKRLGGERRSRRATFLFFSFFSFSLLDRKSH